MTLSHSLALIIYEHIITLREEIQVFWINFKLSSVSVLFISTRLALIASTTRILYSKFPTPVSTTVVILLLRQDLILSEEASPTSLYLDVAICLRLGGRCTAYTTQIEVCLIIGLAQVARKSHRIGYSFTNNPGSNRDICTTTQCSQH